MTKILRMGLDEQFAADCAYSEKVFKERFQGHYPARKTIATEFAHQGGEHGLQVQIDAIAYRGQKTCQL